MQIKYYFLLIKLTEKYEHEFLFGENVRRSRRSRLGGLIGFWWKQKLVHFWKARSSHMLLRPIKLLISFDLIIKCLRIYSRDMIIDEKKRLYTSFFIKHF